MSGYEQIKHLAKEAGCNIPELLVLARQNDPFFVGGKSSTLMAGWFADIWERFGYTNGVHLRRVHYRLVQQENPPTKHNGESYENTEGCWAYLCNAGKYARILGLVDPAAFVDRRNPDPRIYLHGEQVEQPGWFYDWPEWEMPAIKADLASTLDSWEMPETWAEGYEYRDELQSYHVETWAEKTTMNDELIPLCERYGVNLVTGVGYLSITSVINLLRRVSVLDKPCRILYISDFDPAGASMPVSVSRQIEYWIQRYLPNADIRLKPIILTASQIDRYRLPRIPIKDSDLRKGNFETVYGTGAVELDALEAIRPGEFAQIVEQEISAYRDGELREKVDDAYRDATDMLDREQERHLNVHHERLESLKAEVARIADSYQARLTELNDELQEELVPYRGDLESVRQAVQSELLNMEADLELPTLPEGENAVERDVWLYDSERPYFDQLATYKQHQNGGAA